MIKHLNVRLDTIKLLEENIGRILFDINCSNIFFLDPSPRVMEIKTEINKWGLIKLKSFCTAKETINKMKRQPTTERKYLQTMESTRDSFPKYKKQLMELNIKNKTQKQKNYPVKKWTENLNRHFSKEDIQMATRHTKRCSTSLTLEKYKSKPQ